MAGGTAQPGAELLAFERFRDSSKQPLAYGYGPRSLRELRAREFGRLAGEASGDAGLAGRPGGHAVPKELSAPGGCDVTSFGAHFEWKDLEGHVHASASWTRLPEVPPAAPKLLATHAP